MQHLLFGFKKAKFEAGGTGVADESFHLPKNQVTPRKNATLLIPRFG